MEKRKIIVIGGGPAGEAAAKTASSLGADVTLIERDFLGGLCLNYGCIPSKALLKTVRRLHELRALAPRGLHAEGARIEWGELQKRKDEIVSGIRSTLQKHLQSLKVNLVQGVARFRSDHEVEVLENGNVRPLPFDAAIIAGGTSPLFPPPFDKRRPELLDSRSLLAIPKIPKSLLVVGGGAVGCEFACLFRELGAEVTIVEKTSGLIPGEDPTVVSALKNIFESRGIKILTDATADSLEGKPGHWTLSIAGGDKISCEQILVSIGRSPDTAHLGLDQAGIAGSPKGVSVNARMQTNQPHIYAVGDITGTTRLAHAAAVQGSVAAANACGGQASFDGSLVPRCLYTWPEVASVGMWAYEAEARKIEVKSQRFFFKGSATAMSEGETEGFFQVLSEKASGKLLGAQIIGPEATELIHIFSVALKAGMTVEDLKSVIFAHPSLAEGIKEALSR